MTLREAVRTAARRMEAVAELQVSAGRDAELLMLHALGLSRATLLAHPERELTATELTTYEVLVSRRTTCEPIQYIIGEQEFYGLALTVSRAVLIPRPETEHLVEAVLELLAANRPLRMLDVGTGSGAIAIALAVHLPLAKVVAVDVSAAALAVAEGNARAHRVASRMRFVESDLLATVANERFDAVVSNPPYIPVGDRASLHRQVREHEPEEALFAGIKGLDIYRRLIPQTAAVLEPGGLLAMEIGFGQRDAVAAMLEGWDEIRFVDDLQGIARVALAAKRS